MPVPMPISTIDFDRIVPDALQPAAIQAAATERPENLSQPEAAALTTRFWQPGRTLRIAFVDDHLLPAIRQSVHDQVIQVAQEWLEHANVHFDWNQPCKESEIRIAFDPGLGNWSYIGTDALAFQDCEITMNLGELSQDPSEERARHIILHEFGHALGLIHEHQRPASHIQWNREAVIDILSGPPNFWDEEQIEANVFSRYDGASSQFRELLPNGADFDEKSVMVYPIPTAWTLNDEAYAANSELSETDKAFIARHYPA